MDSYASCYYKKLKRLLIVEDKAQHITQIARLSVTDWLLIDLVLVHENVDVIGQNEQDDSNKRRELKTLEYLFKLVLKYNIEKLSGDLLTKAWLNIANDYNKRGRYCSPMLLQRRWFQLKELAWYNFYNFWYLYLGDARNLDSAGRFKPTSLQTEIIKRFSNIVTEQFLTWEEMIKEKKVVLLEDFERYELAQRKGTDADNEPDLVVIEPHVEIIDLRVDSVFDSKDRDSHNALDPNEAYQATDNSKFNVSIVKTEVLDDLSDEDDISMLDDVHRPFESLQPTYAILDRNIDKDAIKNKNSNNVYDTIIIDRDETVNDNDNKDVVILNESKDIILLVDTKDEEAETNKSFAKSDKNTILEIDLNKSYEQRVTPCTCNIISEQNPCLIQDIEKNKCNERIKFYQDIPTGLSIVTTNIEGKISKAKCNVLENIDTLVEPTVLQYDNLTNSTKNIFHTSKQFLPNACETPIRINEIGPQIVERDKMINLPDIDQIRRANERLLIAEITPIQVCTTSSKPPVAILQHTVTTQNINELEIETFKTCELACPNLEKPPEEQPSIENIREFLRKEIPTKRLLALDTVERILNICQGNVHHMKGTKKTNKTIGNNQDMFSKETSVNHVSINSIIKTPIVTDKSEVKDKNNLNILSTEKKERMRINKKPNEITYCCWAREKMLSLPKHCPRLISPHTCPLPVCTCCCNNEYMKKLRELYAHRLDSSDLLSDSDKKQSYESQEMNTDDVSHNPDDLQASLSSTTRNQLSTMQLDLNVVSSFLELKEAYDKNKQFYKMDIETGKIIPINVSIKSHNKQKYIPILPNSTNNLIDHDGNGQDIICNPPSDELNKPEIKPIKLFKAVHPTLLKGSGNSILQIPVTSETETLQNERERLTDILNREEKEPTEEDIHNEENIAKCDENVKVKNVTSDSDDETLALRVKRKKNVDNSNVKPEDKTTHVNINDITESTAASASSSVNFKKSRKAISADPVLQPVVFEDSSEEDCILGV